MKWVAASRLMQEALARAERFAQTGSVILIGGETGTGKSALAQFIHEKSPRGQEHKPLAVVDGTYIHQEDLWHSMAFGHTRGSFTGALENRPGVLMTANGGTVLLEEIGELSLSLQSKLLRFLDNGEIFALGSDQAQKTDVRIIAATNRDLWKMVREQTFREDLFYRLSVLDLTMPALRDRPEDIEVLIRNRLEIYRKTIAKDALTHLLRYSWPGNVRELLNVMERATVLSEREVGLEHIPDRVRGGSPVKNQLAPSHTPRPLVDIEREHILTALEYHKGNKQAASASLGISLKTLYNRLSEYQSSGSPVQLPS